MRKVLFIFGVLVITSSHAQDSNGTDDISNSYTLIRSTTGISGSSSTHLTPYGRYLLSQSIGQSSIIGTGSNAGYTLRQGYQQPSILADVIQGIDDNELDATIYPNPFQHSIFISFGERITKDIEIDLFDITGKLIFSKKFSPSQQVRLSITDISNGSYIINVRSSNKRISATLIKK